VRRAWEAAKAAELSTEQSSNGDPVPYRDLISAFPCIMKCEHTAVVGPDWRRPVGLAVQRVELSCH
jgi:hypothetical protein